MRLKDGPKKKKRVIQLGENPRKVFNVGPLARESISHVKFLKKSELEKRLEETGLDTTGYNKKWARYYIDINKDDIKKHQEFLTNTFKSAYN